MDLMEAEWKDVDWMHLALDRDQWWAVANIVMIYPSIHLSI
jgi:hypothetical protein